MRVFNLYLDKLKGGNRRKPQSDCTLISLYFCQSPKGTLITEFVDVTKNRSHKWIWKGERSKIYIWKN